MTKIGRFEVVRRLATGGMGAIYLARDPGDERLVAVKIVGASRDDEHVRQRVAREAQLVARLHHPNVIAFVDAGEQDGAPFIAFEYVAGSSLDTLLKRNPPPALPDRLAFIEQLCDGLAHIHAAGIVHGDIKPANLMVADDGPLKILDFGLAELAADARANEGLIGTPNYMAPERIKGEGHDHRVDIFAAGVVMYEAVALRQAFPGGIGDGLLDRIALDGPRLTEQTPGIAPELARIVDRALERKPENRYQSVDEMRRDLAEVRRRPLESSYSPPPDGFSIGSPATAAMTPHQRELLDEILTPAGGRDGPASGGSVTVFARDAAMPGDTAVPPVDDVQFTLYRPKAVRPHATYPMLVFTHRGDRPPDQPDAPLPIEQVRSRAGQLLGADARLFRDTTTDAKHAVPAYGEITLVPRVHGIEFTPERHTFRWATAVHEHRFELTARPKLDGQVARGSLTAYLGVLLLAEVDLAIRVDASAPLRERAEPAESVTARAYRKIFASYSRKDVAIVEQFERIVAALGDSYLRDVRNLRAGERWEDGLLRLIDEADVFQLFWSWNAMRSPNVRREWEYALSLNRPSFVRPTYWETPLPESTAEGLPPARLREFHFHHLGLPSTREPQTSGGRAADDDTDAIRRTEASAARPAAPQPAPPGPVPSAVRNRSMIRRLRFIGAAAVVVLAMAAGTMVLRNQLQDSPPMASPGDDPPPAPVPAAQDRASIERLLAEYADAVSRRDEAAIRAIDPAFEGFSGGPPATRTTPTDVVITVAPDGRSAAVRARLQAEAPRGRAAASPRPPAELRWSLRKEGDAWKVVR